MNSPPKESPAGSKTPTLRVRVSSTDNLLDGREVTLKGCVAWMARHLIDAGGRGITTAQLPPDVRVSDSILKLRREGYRDRDAARRPRGTVPGPAWSLPASLSSRTPRRRLVMSSYRSRRDLNEGQTDALAGAAA